MPGGAPQGNDNGRRGTEWRDALRAAAAERGKGNYRTTLIKLANRVFDLAESGDVACIKEIGDRFDGKAHQSSEVDVRGSVQVMITPTDGNL